MVASLKARFVSGDDGNPLNFSSFPSSSILPRARLANIWPRKDTMQRIRENSKLSLYLLDYDGYTSWYLIYLFVAILSSYLGDSMIGVI